MSVRKEVEERPIENSPALQIGTMAEEYQSIFDEQINIFQTESAKVKENFDKQLKKVKKELLETKAKLTKKEAVEAVAEKNLCELG